MSRTREIIFAIFLAVAGIVIAFAVVRYGEYKTCGPRDVKQSTYFGCPNFDPNAPPKEQP